MVTTESLYNLIRWLKQYMEGQVQIMDKLCFKVNIINGEVQFDSVLIFTGVH